VVPSSRNFSLADPCSSPFRLSFSIFSKFLTIAVVPVDRRKSAHGYVKHSLNAALRSVESWAKLENQQAV
jgi:hypothetical protein